MSRALVGAPASTRWRALAFKRGALGRPLRAHIVERTPVTKQGNNKAASNLKGVKNVCSALKLFFFQFSKFTFSDINDSVIS